MVKFLAVLDQVGINPCVTVPDRVSRHFGKRGYVPVVAHFETGSVRSTLVPIGGGVHRLYVNEAVAKSDTLKAEGGTAIRFWSRCGSHPRSKHRSLIENLGV